MRERSQTKHRIKDERLIITEINSICTSDRWKERAGSRSLLIPESVSILKGRVSWLSATVSLQDSCAPR